MEPGEKICVGSMVIFIMAGTIGTGLGIGIATGGSTPRYVVEILGWISILSLIPICGFLCSKLLDDTSAKEREALRQIRHESPRVLMPESYEQPAEEMIEDEMQVDE